MFTEHDSERLVGSSPRDSHSKADLGTSTLLGRHTTRHNQILSKSISSGPLGTGLRMPSMNEKTRESRSVFPIAQRFQDGLMQISNGRKVPRSVLAPRALTSCDGSLNF